MIERDKIKAGDTVVLRDGSRKVVTKDISALFVGGRSLVDCWDKKGFQRDEDFPTDFDIVRVEPKKVKKREFFIAFNKETLSETGAYWDLDSLTCNYSPTKYHFRKITISEDGSEDKIERV